MVTYRQGDSFGELALMYNAPRAATVLAKGDCALWALDRLTFKVILMDTTGDKRRRYEAFLSRVRALRRCVGTRREREGRLGKTRALPPCVTSPPPPPTPTPRPPARPP